MAHATFENAVLAEVTKKVLTELDIAKLAATVKPQLEREFASNLKATFSDYLQEHLWDMLDNDDEFKDNIRKAVFSAFNMPEPTRKARRY